MLTRRARLDKNTGALAEIGSKSKQTFLAEKEHKYHTVGPQIGTSISNIKWDFEIGLQFETCNLHYIRI